MFRTIVETSRPDQDICFNPEMANSLDRKSPASLYDVLSPYYNLDRMRRRWRLVNNRPHEPLPRHTLPIGWQQYRRSRMVVLFESASQGLACLTHKWKVSWLNRRATYSSFSVKRPDRDSRHMEDLCIKSLSPHEYRRCLAS